MSNMLRLFAFAALLTIWGCDEHQPVENDDPPPPGLPDIGAEHFIQGPTYFDPEGVERFLLQSDRVISVIFDSTASNTQLRQVASNFELRLFPELTRPADVDWDTEKRRTSLWVVPEGADINAYYTVFPRFEDDESFFGWHPVVKKSLPSYADPDLIDRLFIDNRFFAYTTPEITGEDIADWNNFNGVEILDVRTIDTEIEYHMRITANSRFATIRTANEYHVNGFFIRATPDFIFYDFNN